MAALPVNNLGVDIEELKTLSDRLHRLLAEPEPGLISWQAMVNRTVLEIACGAIAESAIPGPKAQLFPKPHSQIPGAIVVEVWHGGQLIGTVTGADGPGIRFQSIYPLGALGRMASIEVTATLPHGQ